MTYKLAFKSKAVRDLKKLEPQTARRVLSKLELLQEDLQGDVKRLTKFTPEYRLRVGDYRVLFETVERTIVVYRVRHRREVYG